MDEHFYLKKAIAVLDSEKDETALKSVLLLLWYTATSEGDATITQYARGDGVPVAIRDYARQLQERAAQIAKQAKKSKDLLKKVEPPIPVESDFAQLKAIRRQRFTRISDEALIELDQLTALMRAKQILK